RRRGESAHCAARNLGGRQPVFLAFGLAGAFLCPAWAIAAFERLRCIFTLAWVVPLAAVGVTLAAVVVAASAGLAMRPSAASDAISSFIIVSPVPWEGMPGGKRGIRSG